MLVCGRDLVCRASDFEKRVEAMSLRPWQWELLFALDGRTPLENIAERVGIDMSVACEAIRSLHEQGLITIRMLRIDEYRHERDMFTLPSMGFEPSQLSAMPPMPMPMPAQEQAPPPPMAFPQASPLPSGISFSLKAPPNPARTPGAVPQAPSGSIGFKIKNPSS